VNSSDEDFSPSSTLFICNKWDVVPITDRDEVRKGIVYRIDQIYQGLRPEQIVYFSSTEVYYIIFFFDCDTTYMCIINVSTTIDGLWCTNATFNNINIQILGK
jgi:hypothetical protein